MRRIITALSLAAVLGVTAIHAQTPAAGQQLQPSATQAQPSEQAVTMNGCVYRTTDDSTFFALERTADADTTGTQAIARAPEPAGNAAPVGTSGSNAPGAARSSTDQSGLWYHLSRDAAPDLGDLVGKPVRVIGTIVPGKDAKNADVVMHRFEPGKVTVTTVDMKPAPELKIQDVTVVEGQCGARARQQ